MKDKSNTLQEKFSTGVQTGSIDVRISHRIIQLFSEGLYSSSNKAIEELVSNSFDAGAQKVHVILSPDLLTADATIVVIDDGEGMDAEGLKQHWIIGHSTRRVGEDAQKRRPIGKFGIGKLATYVLAKRLTHICKVGEKYFSATMDYTALGANRDFKTPSDTGIFNDEKISIPLMELTEAQGREILKPWITVNKPGYKAFRLFGENASKSWTVAIMSDLTDMGKKIGRGRLKWILRTAMPLRDDFKLYLDGNLLESSKIKIPLVQKWIIGKDITSEQLGDPCPKGLEPTENEDEPIESVHRHGLAHSELGRITGYMEVYKDDLTGGKSSDEYRSYGFFVYVRGRMINVEEENEGFGIPRNQLRHGTFSKFRMVVYIDSLDEALRSSRETFQQEGGLYKLAQNFLRACFNLARNRLAQHENSQLPGAIISERISSAPGSLTRKPLMSLAEKVIYGEIKPLYSRIPENLTEIEKEVLIEKIQEKNTSDELLLQDIKYVELSSTDGIAIYDLEGSTLQINTNHPFVSAFQELFQKPSTSLPLEMYAMAEVLMEANLYHMTIQENVIHDILTRRDELMRQLVKSSGRRTPGMIALALIDAKNDENKLEIEVRAAFEAMGFANVIRLGGSGKPDGTAEAYLAASDDGKERRYKVGLEAKSGGKVDAKRLGVSGLGRHMAQYKCDHHIVVGNSFATTSDGNESASAIEIQDFKNNNLGKTITLIHIDDLARLVRLVPAKRIGLDRLRRLFQTCTLPDETKRWVDQIVIEKPEQWPYKEILNTIWDRANKRPNEVVEYAAVFTALEYLTPSIKITKLELIECCKAMQVMARGVVFARESNVEINRRPDLVLQDIHEAIDEYYTDEERKTIII